MPVERCDSRTATRRSCLLAAVFTGLLTATPALHAQDALLDGAQAQLAAGNAAGAYATLEPAEAERAGEPVFDYLLGRAALESGKLTNAVFALERVVAVQPDNLLARADLARAYAQLREFEAAQQELETVQSGQIPDAARAQIDRYLGAVETAISHAKTQVRGYLSVSGGYDSNVNSATSDSTVAIPSLGGIVVTLGPGSTGASDQFATFRGGAVVRHVIQPDLSLNAGFDVAAKVLDERNTVDTRSLTGSVGVDYVRNDNTWTAALQAENFRVDKNTFRNAFGVLGQVRRPVGPAGGVTAYVQATTLSYPATPVRDANRYTVGGAYSQAFEGEFSPVAYVGAYGGVEDEHASGVAFLGHKFVGIRAGLGLAATRDLDLSASGSVEYRDYGGTDPLFLRSREDKRYSLRLAGDYRPDGFWTFTPAVELSKNDSNIAINDYKRAVVSVTLRRDFR